MGLGINPKRIRICPAGFSCFIAAMAHTVHRYVLYCSKRCNNKRHSALTVMAGALWVCCLYAVYVWARWAAFSMALLILPIAM